MLSNRSSVFFVFQESFKLNKWVFRSSNPWNYYPHAHPPPRKSFFWWSQLICSLLKLAFITLLHWISRFYNCFTLNFMKKYTYRYNSEKKLSNMVENESAYLERSVRLKLNKNMIFVFFPFFQKRGRKILWAVYWKHFYLIESIRLKCLPVKKTNFAQFEDKNMEW